MPVPILRLHDNVRRRRCRCRWSRGRLRQSGRRRDANLALEPGQDGAEPDRSVPVLGPVPVQAFLWGLGLGLTEHRQQQF